MKPEILDVLMRVYIEGPALKSYETSQAIKTSRPLTSRRNKRLNMSYKPRI